MSEGATWVAFLRAINVGGRRVTMDELAALFEQLDDVDDVSTYLASGNVMFRSPDDAASLASRIAAHLEESLQFDVPTIVRSADEVVALVESDVFAEEAAPKHRKLYVTLLSEPPGPEHADVLDRLSGEVDSFRVVERDVFWLRDMEAGESMNNYELEKALGIVGTRRTMNTLARIANKIR